MEEGDYLLCLGVLEEGSVLPLAHRFDDQHVELQGMVKNTLIEIGSLFFGNVFLQEGRDNYGDSRVAHGCGEN